MVNEQLTYTAEGEEEAGLAAGLADFANEWGDDTSTPSIDGDAERLSNQPTTPSEEMFHLLNESNDDDNVKANEKGNSSNKKP